MTTLSWGATRTARGDHNRLGLALLLVWTRVERVVVSNPATLPEAVVAHVGHQLGLMPTALHGYGQRPATHSAHAGLVCAHLGVRPFAVRDERGLRAYLHGKAAHTGNTAALLDAAAEWVVREGLLRPLGETTLERVVYATRAAAEEDLFARIAGQLSPEECGRLDAVCATDEGVSALATLATPSTQPSAPAIHVACAHLESVRAVLPVRLDWGAITSNRRRQWAALVRRQPAQALRRYPPAKRHTLLLAFLAVRGEELTDDIVEMFDTLIGRVFGDSTDELTEAKAARAQALAEGAQLFRTVGTILLDPDIPPEGVRDAVFRQIPRERVSAVVEDSAAADGTDADLFVATLGRHFRHIRSFAPPLLATLRFGSPRASNELVEALEVLATMNAERRLHIPPTAPVGFIPKRWAKAIVRPEGVDRHGWESCLLHEARSALRAGDLTVEGSRRYTPWDTDLYAPAAWTGRRATWAEESDMPLDGAAYAARAVAELDALTDRVARRLPRNADARVVDGKVRLTALDAVEVPREVEMARDALTDLLPESGLPDLLMEVDRWTGFSQALTHLGGRRAPTPAHLAQVRPALFAVLIAEATNLGLATMARASGISEAQLTRVYDWYFREDTLRQAITSVIHYHGTLPLTARFGDGTTSSSDGMRFGVSSSAINARHNPPFFARRRGLTLYSHVSDQGPQFWIDVVNCLMREATYVLDGLVYQDALPIHEHYSDTAGYTDLIFGLFDMLGYRFAPRLRDLPDQVLYQARKEAEYGALDSVLRQSLRPELIVQHWDDLNRLAASFKDGLVRPSLVVAKLQAMQRQNPLQQAIQELGRLAKTRHILSYIDDVQLRRRILVGLNRQERLHALARAIFFGRQGRFGDRSYEAQLNRASALSLVINAIIVWDTEYLAAAAAELAWRGQPVPDAAWSHITPLHWAHIHLVGHYHFEEPEIVGRLRPLRVKRHEDNLGA